MSEFLKQLQESAGLLNNKIKDTDTTQIRNLFGNYNPTSASDYMGGIAQNRFVGNQFQMPFNMGQQTPFGGNYGSGGFGSYTPGRFNQYGNIGTTAGVDNIISSLLGPGADRGGEGDAGGMFGGVQGQNDPSNPRNRQDSYNRNDDGTITQYDASTGLTTTYDLDDEGLTFAQKLFGNIAKVPTTASLVESAVGGLIGNLTDTGFDVNSNMPSNQLENPTNNPLIASYNQMITENIPGLPVSPINIPEVDLSLPTGLLTGVDQGPTNEFGRTQAEQNAINDSVNIGNPDGTINVGFGQNAEGDYEGLVTGGPNNSPVTTGFTNNTASINNPAAVAAITANRDRRGRGAGGTVGGSNQGGYGDGAGGACFDPNTYIKMQDGSEKKIKDVQLGDFTKGGKVTGVLQFEPIDDIHEYKGVIVAGSHFVKEGNEFIMVQDSPESVKIDKIPVVYSLDTTNRRIFINNIEFADYNGDGIAKKFLNNAGMDLSGFDKEVLRQVEHRLI